MDQTNQITKASRIHKTILNFIKYFAPVVVIALIMNWLGLSSGKPELSVSYIFFEVVGWVTMIWCALIVYVFFLIAFNKEMKNKCVRTLAGIKENDERETYITGVASKKTFISITGILIMLVFLSSLQISVYQVPESEAKNGKRGTVAIGMGLKIIDDSKVTINGDENRTYFVNYKGLHLAKDGLLILVLALQVGSFYYFSKKESAVG